MHSLANDSAQLPQSNAGQDTLHLDEFQVRVNHTVRPRCCNLVDAIAVHMVPKLDEITVQVIEVHPVLAVLTNNEEGGMMPDMPGLFIKAEGVECFGGG